MIGGRRVCYLRIVLEDERDIWDLYLGFHFWTIPSQKVWEQCWWLVDPCIAAKVPMCVNPISSLRPEIVTCIHRSFNERHSDIDCATG